jgi:hypothetical protein
MMLVYSAEEMRMFKAAAATLVYFVINNDSMH